MFLETRRGLAAYVPSDAREAEFQRRMLELLDSPAPFSRGQASPGHFTASAFVISPDGRQLLLIFHKKLGKWLQPGGHVEAGDASLPAAAAREVAEEVGIALASALVAAAPIFDIDIHPIPAHKVESAHEHFDVRFKFPASTLAFARTDEVADARWVPLVELPQLTDDESVLRAARKLG